MFSLSGTAIQFKQNPRDLRRWRRLWDLYLFGYSDIWFPVLVVRAWFPLSVNPLVLVKYSRSTSHESNERGTTFVNN